MTSEAATQEATVQRGSTPGLLHALVSQLDEIAVVALDRAGSIAAWNVGAVRIFGYSEVDAIGRTIEFLFRKPGGDDGSPNFELPLIASGARFHDELEAVRRDGTTFWASVILQRVIAEVGDLQGYALVVRDVTTRRRQEDGLRAMVEMSLNALVLVDESGKILSVNAQTEKMFGYPREQLIGKTVELLVPQRYQRQHVHDRAAFFRNPTMRPMGAGRDLFGRRNDGSEFPVEIGLSPILTVDGPAVLGSIVDITERQRAERRFRSAVESAPNAMVMINCEGKIVLVNLQTERLFGYAREELLEQPVEILVPERFRKPHPAMREAFFASPTVRSMGAGRDLFGRRKDGSEFPVEIGLNPIETGDETLVLSAIVDITARKEAEDRARNQLAELAHVARLSTVGQMFSELAHEINQPLAAASNYARACVAFARNKQGGVTPEQMVEWMEKTVAQTTRAVDIVKRLGSFVKKDGGTRSLVNVNRLIEQVVSLSVSALRTPSDDGPSIELELMLDEGAPNVSADRVQIEQVLLNLVRNAIEAVQNSGRLRRKLTIRTSFDREVLTVVVSDTGPGIPPENLARLFEPYFTTKSSGMGLGLSISRSIVEDHGGRLEARSSAHGADVYFTLPLSTGRIAL